MLGSFTSLSGEICKSGTTLALARASALAHLAFVYKLSGLGKKEAIKMIRLGEKSQPNCRAFKCGSLDGIPG